MRRSPIHPLLVILVAAACGSGGPPVAEAPAPTAGASAVPGVAGADYPLLPGDVIRLRIWREPDLSGDFRVDEYGLVTLPKIGSLAAAEMTPAQLERTIRERFDRYLRNPSIEVVPLRRINILGAVRAPGLYPVDPTMTLRDAIALAGGVLPNGRDDQVALIRGEERLLTRFTGDTRIVDLGIRSGDQVYVPERSWLSRNAGVVAGVASTIIASGVSLLIALRPWE